MSDQRKFNDEDKRHKTWNGQEKDKENWKITKSQSHKITRWCYDWMIEWPKRIGDKDKRRIKREDEKSYKVEIG